MVQFEESRNDAEANIAVAGTGAAAQQRVVPKRSLNYVITFAYVSRQLEKRLAPCGTVPSITELAAHLSTYMQLVVPRQQLIEPPPPPAQMLRFTNEIPAEIFTNDTIVLKIELVNIKSGLICSTGEPSPPLQVEIFVTEGDFPSNDKLRTCEPLRQRERAHNLPLLVQATYTQRRRGLSFRDTSVAKMHKGRAVAKVKITDNSSWVRSKMFKLVARVKGRRIKEALSAAFAVKEAKLKGKKADVPSPTDPTSKLNYVGNKSYKILQAMGINTVQDFLNKLESDPKGLKATVGMQNAKWELTVDHARQCIVSLEQEPGMTETNEATFAPGQDINVFNSGVITITDPLLNASVPNADLPHTPEIQAQYMAAHLSTHMQLVVPRQQPIEPPPAQMLRFTEEIPAEMFTNYTIDLQMELEPSMTETNEETFAPGQDINVFNSGVITITDRLLNASVPNADLPYTPEIQVMGQQRDPAACFGSDYSNPISSLNGNNGSLGEVFGEMPAQPEMPEQASTGQGMTMVNGSNFPSPENNQWNSYFYADQSPSNDNQTLWDFS